MSDLERLRNKEIRMVSAKRKRKIQKREDVFVFWSVELNSYVWESVFSDPAVDHSCCMAEQAAYGRSYS